MKFHLNPADLHGNALTPVFTYITGSSGEGYWNVGTGARWKFTTSATKVVVRYYATQTFGSTNNNIANMISYRVDGILYMAGAAMGGDQTIEIYLPAGRGKLFELFVPIQNAASITGAPTGVYFMDADFIGCLPSDTAVSAPPSSGPNMVLVTDSIGVGNNALAGSGGGLIGQLSQSTMNGGFNGRVTAFGWGYASLFGMVSRYGGVSGFATYVASLNPSVIYMMLGTNDYLAQSAANFQTMLVAFLNALATTSASAVPVKWVTPLMTYAPNNREVPFSYDALDAYRLAITNGVPLSVKSNTSVIDGKAILVQADLNDGLHPTTAGHTKYRPTFV